MTSAAIRGFPASSGSDRNAFLVFVALVWIGVLSGFGTDSFDHVRQQGFDYPLIVHLHAVIFMSWLVLFTTQVALIRGGRRDLHRRLGVAAMGLAAVMVVLGPATALVVSAHDFAASGKTPEFLAVQFTTIVAFASLTGAGFLLRAVPAAHKRLMLLSLMYLAAPGFVRYLNGVFTQGVGHGYWRGLLHTYFCSDVLMLGLGAYDLVRLKRLHPAYIGGVCLAFALQLTAVGLLHNPAWKVLSLKLIGH